MRTSLFRLVALVAVLAALAVDMPAGQAAPAAPTGRARVVHAVPDAPAVDVLVDGAKVFTGVAFKTVTPYAQLSPGPHQFQVVPSGLTSPVVISATLPIVANQDISIAAINTLAAVQSLVLIDDNSLPTAGMARVRFVHAVPDAPAVDIYVKGATTPTFANVAFGHASNYAEVAAGTYDLQVRLAGSPISSTPVFTATNVTVANQGVYTAWAMGQMSAGTVSAVVSWDRLPVLPVKYFLPAVYKNP